MTVINGGGEPGCGERLWGGGGVGGGEDNGNEGDGGGGRGGEDDGNEGDGGGDVEGGGLEGGGEQMVGQVEHSLMQRGVRTSIWSDDVDATCMIMTIRVMIMRPILMI